MTLSWRGLLALGGKRPAGILVAGILLAVWSATARADITVDDDGPADYNTIQEAVDNATPGETILVAPGFYPEEVQIPLSVTISGAGAGQTLVVPATSRPGSGSGSQLGSTAWVFRISASDVTIASLTILGDNPDIGGPIDARGGIVTDFTAGIYDRLLVTGVEVDGVAYRGIYAGAGGTGHQFLTNTVRNVNQVFLDSVGIFCYDADSVVRGNTVEGCSIGIGFHNSGGGQIQNNSCTNCDLGVLANGSTLPVAIDGNTISGCVQGVQTIALDSAVSITNNVLSGYGWGLVCFGLGTGSNTLDNNTLDGGSTPGSIGFEADSEVLPWGPGDVHATLTRNTFTANDYGVVLHESLIDATPFLDVTLSTDQTLFNSFTDSISFNVFLDGCNDSVDATWNFWGVANPNRIEDSIWHQNDDPGLGLVDFSNSVNLYVTVDDDGGADYTTINPAVQAAWPGGTVFVFPGLYVEDVSIDRPLLLQGSGTDADPLLGSVVRSTGFSPTDAVVTAAADGVRIEALHIDGFVVAGDNRIQRGIYGALIDDFQVAGCLVDGAVSGVESAISTNGLFTDNELVDCGRAVDDGAGIILNNSTGAVGVLGGGNYVHDSFGPGVVLTNSSSGTVDGNRMNSVELGVLCDTCSAATTVTGNEVSNATQGYQAVRNQASVVFDDNIALACDTGYALFPLNTVPVTFSNNFADGLGSATNGFYATTHAPSGIGDANGVLYGNGFVGCTYGVHFFESIVSDAFAVNVNMDGTPAANVMGTNSLFDVFLDGCNDDISAIGNQFVTSDSAQIESRIWHKNDDINLGLVTFSGFLPYGPELHMYGGFEMSYTVSIVHIGLPNETFFLFTALGPGFLPSPWGDFLIDPVTMRYLFSGPTGSLGIMRIWGAVPGELPPGFDLYFQSVITEPGGAKVTNVAVKTTR